MKEKYETLGLATILTVALLLAASFLVSAASNIFNPTFCTMLNVISGLIVGAVVGLLLYKNFRYMLAGMAVGVVALWLIGVVIWVAVTGSGIQTITLLSNLSLTSFVVGFVITYGELIVGAMTAILFTKDVIVFKGKK